MAKTKRKDKKAAAKATPTGKLSRKTFDRELEKLQVELCHLQEWVKHQELRLILEQGRIFGRVILRFTQATGVLKLHKILVLGREGIEVGRPRTGTKSVANFSPAAAG